MVDLDETVVCVDEEHDSSIDAREKASSNKNNFSIGLVLRLMVSFVFD